MTSRAFAFDAMVVSGMSILLVSFDNDELSFISPDWLSVPNEPQLMRSKSKVG